MPLSNAERQRRHRERAKASTTRISFSISTDAATALDALAEQTGTTKRNALEAAILRARPALPHNQNPEHQRLFQIPEPVTSASTDLVAPTLPEPQTVTVTGDREVDACLWLASVCKTATDPAVLDRAAEAASRITTPAKEIEDRYANWLRNQTDGHPMQIAFAVIGAGDLKRQIEAARERIIVYREGLAVFGSYRAAMQDTPAEQMILHTIGPLPDGHEWDWKPHELDRLFERSVNPVSLTEVCDEQRYWSWLSRLRWRMAQTAGDEQGNGYAAVDARHWWLEHLLTTMAPQSPAEVGQRIFQQPFPWTSLGVDIRGRSQTLRINYGKSRQIRTQADKLMRDTITDVYGGKDSRRGTQPSSTRAPNPKTSPAAWRAQQPPSPSAPCTLPKATNTEPSPSWPAMTSCYLCSSASTA